MNGESLKVKKASVGSAFALNPSVLWVEPDLMMQGTVPMAFEQDLTYGALDAVMLSAGLVIWYVKLKTIERRVEEAQKNDE